MTAGLERVGELEVGAGYLEAQVGAVGQLGVDAAWLAQVEAGWRVAAPVDLFGFGRAELAWGVPVEWQAGIGARVRW